MKGRSRGSANEWAKVRQIRAESRERVVRLMGLKKKTEGGVQMRRSGSIRCEPRGSEEKTIGGRKQEKRKRSCSKGTRICPRIRRCEKVWGKCLGKTEIGVRTPGVIVLTRDGWIKERREDHGHPRIWAIRSKKTGERGSTTG